MEKEEVMAVVVRGGIFDPTMRNCVTGEAILGKSVGKEVFEEPETNM